MRPGKRGEAERDEAERRQVECLLALSDSGFNDVARLKRAVKQHDCDGEELVVCVSDHRRPEMVRNHAPTVK